MSQYMNNWYNHNDTVITCVHSSSMNNMWGGMSLLRGGRARGCREGERVSARSPRATRDRMRRMLAQSDVACPKASLEQD